ncbi:MAG: CBASS cGAMP synthase [Gallionella sp.]|nr:CBASS cGAMP synthase [Gallionella sp.]MDD4959468.1 CBASS cGAMP synthase [Gallionella sp.]
MLNFSSLFYTTTEEKCFLNNLDLDVEHKKLLNDAKSEVRRTLKDNLPKILAEIAGDSAVAEPRFFTQGSWAYKTLNAPAQSPQQADLDDGAYLPLGFISEINKPSVASEIYFRAVEKALLPLAQKNKWKLITDKPTCTRLEINSKSHIDIPLYAIPDKEFVLLKKAAEARYISLGSEFAEQDAWTALPKNMVLLAHREDDWKVSDPRPIKEWFLTQVRVDMKGEQLRRVVRYLKAYRDHQWTSGGPSSILLMAAVVPVFENRKYRDDLALLDVVRQLPSILRKGVCNPIDQSESLTARLGAKDVEEAATKFEELCKYLTASLLQATDTAQASIWMCNQFGRRFPYSPDRIQDVTPSETIASAAALVTATPLVGRTQAG